MSLVLVEVLQVTADSLAKFPLSASLHEENCMQGSYI